MPDANLVRAFRAAVGGHRPVQVGVKVNWDADRDAAVKEAHRLWADEQLPGQLAQTLPRPRDCADAMTLVPPDAFADAIACGTDADDHAAQVQAYAGAGIDEVYVQQTGPDTVSSQLARRRASPLHT